MKQGLLVLVRHGESRWNLLNRFTGWIDIPLSEAGVREAQRCAKHCAKFTYDAAFTSNLERAQETLLVILSRQKKIGVFQHSENGRYHQLDDSAFGIKRSLLPIFTSEKLNERAYGILQGMNKNTAKRKHGAKAVFKWRREYTGRPPKGESLKDVHDRIIPFFKNEILPRCIRGEKVLLTAHGNTLRAVIKHIESIDNKKISFVDLPNAHPLVYRLRKGRFERIEGEYRFNRPLR